MTLPKLHLVLGLLWLLAGMALGEHMGRSGDHTQMPTHAHIMLLGGVLPLAFSLIYRVFGLATGLIAWIQFVVHHIAVAMMVTGLYLLYGGLAPESQVGPFLGISALLAILSVALMLLLSIRAKT